MKKKEERDREDDEEAEEAEEEELHVLRYIFSSSCLKNVAEPLEIRHFSHNGKIIYSN